MKRNKFNLSHTRLLSCNMGSLIPLTWMEVLPGDSFQQQTHLLLRCSPLLTPVMHPVRVRLHHFYVPWRLVWNDFEDFITGGPDGLNSSVYPTVSIGPAGPSVGSLSDHLGVPTGIASQFYTSALPFRAYNLIWNEWYRDKDLQTPVANIYTSGVDGTSNRTMQNVSWEKDYFTSARPWAQKGPTVTLPLGNQAPVKGIGLATTGASAAVQQNYWATSSADDGTNIPGVRTDAIGPIIRTQNTGAISASNRPMIYADLANASAVTVNTLREALALQRYEEARARYGSDYVDYLAYLGIRSSDARLQRPEYLGGGVQTIQFSEVLQTAEGTDPVGDLKGHGIATVRSNRYRRFFEEHGMVITLMSVLPKTIYMDGLYRHWNRRAKDDFWQKEFEHIGQQEVQNKEVRLNSANPDGIFGWQDRYDEYRRHPSYVSGEFRTTLNMWHFARSFASDPALNAAFVSAVPTEAPFAVPSADVLWVHAKHSVQARRMVSKTGTSFIF